MKLELLDRVETDVANRKMESVQREGLDGKT